MRALFLLALACCIGMRAVRSAYAIPAFDKEFKNKYVKKDSTNEADKALVLVVETVKCNVCHVGTQKKMRNEYGKALDELLDKKTDIKDVAKIQSALEKVESMKSDPKNPNSPTFGELLKQGKLPGDAAAAPAAAAAADGDKQ